MPRGLRSRGRRIIAAPAQFDSYRQSLGLIYSPRLPRLQCTVEPVKTGVSNTDKNTACVRQPPVINVAWGGLCQSILASVLILEMMCCSVAIHNSSCPNNRKSYSRGVSLSSGHQPAQT